MKKFLICGLVLTLFFYFANGSSDEERRFRDGNNAFSRKMRSCGFLCNFKGNRGTYNQTRCYRIPSKNIVVTDCVFKCLRSKGESPEAKECKCSNGVCIEEATTAAPTEQPTTAPTDPPTTQAPTTQPPNTAATTQPPNNAATNQPPNNAASNTQNARRNGNQGQKRVKSQNSKKGNHSKQKS